MEVETLDKVKEAIRKGDPILVYQRGPRMNGSLVVRLCCDDQESHYYGAFLSTTTNGKSGYTSIGAVQADQFEVRGDEIWIQ